MDCYNLVYTFKNQVSAKAVLVSVIFLLCVSMCLRNAAQPLGRKFQFYGDGRSAVFQVHCYKSRLPWRVQESGRGLHGSPRPARPQYPVGSPSHLAGKPGEVAFKPVEMFNAEREGLMWGLRKRAGPPWSQDIRMVACALLGGGHHSTPRNDPGWQAVLRGCLDTGGLPGGWVFTNAEKW